MTDPVVGIFGTYPSVSSALDAGETLIEVIETYEETASWKFEGGEYQISLRPDVNILYAGTDPLMINGVDFNSFYIVISGGTITTSAKYLAKMNAVEDSDLTFDYVSIILGHPSAVISNYYTTFNACNISCNVLDLTDMDESDILFYNCFMTGTYIVSKKNAFVTIQSSAVMGVLKLIANYPNLPLDGSVILPNFYTINDSYINILLLSSNETSGYDAFCGLVMNNGWIDNLFNTSNLPVYLAFSTLNNVVIFNADLQGINNLYLNMYQTTLRNNVLFSSIRFGDCTTCFIDNNNFEYLAFGNNIGVGALNGCTLSNNLMYSLTIYPGMNYNATINKNTVVLPDQIFDMQGGFERANISNNKVSAMVFSGEMKFNTLFSNNVQDITYKNYVDSDDILRSENLNVLLECLSYNMILRYLLNSHVMFKNKASNAKLHHNHNTSVKFKRGVNALDFAHNTDGSASFYGKVKCSQIVNNIKVKFCFAKKLVDTFFNSNVLPKKIRVENCNSIVEPNIVTCK